VKHTPIHNQNISEKLVNKLVETTCITFTAVYVFSS